MGGIVRRATLNTFRLRRLLEESFDSMIWRFITPKLETESKILRSFHPKRKIKIRCVEKAFRGKRPPPTERFKTPTEKSEFLKSSRRVANKFRVLYLYYSKSKNRALEKFMIFGTCLFRTFWRTAGGGKLFSQTISYSRVMRFSVFGKFRFITGLQCELPEENTTAERRLPVRDGVFGEKCLWGGIQGGP